MLPSEIEYENINMGSRGTDIVLWDNSSLGNYLSNYNDADDNGGGFRDSPYVIDEYNQDNFPLMNQLDISEISEFPSWAPY